MEKGKKDEYIHDKEKVFDLKRNEEDSGTGKERGLDNLTPFYSPFIAVLFRTNLSKKIRDVFHGLQELKSVDSGLLVLN